jgi:hypothetical protein
MLNAGLDLNASRSRNSPGELQMDILDWCSSTAESVVGRGNVTSDSANGFYRLFPPKALGEVQLKRLTTVGGGFALDNRH